MWKESHPPEVFAVKMSTRPCDHWQASGAASLGAAASRTRKAWCQWMPPNAFVTSRLTSALSGLCHAAALSWAISTSAPPDLPAPNW